MVEHLTHNCDGAGLIVFVYIRHNNSPFVMGNTLATYRSVLTFMRGSRGGDRGSGPPLEFENFT